MKRILKFEIIILTAGFLLFAQSAWAANIFFEAENSDIQVGAKFEIGLFLNTEDQDINALEGKIIFPQDLLELKEIKDGNSIINFWIARPKVSNNEILFSGIIPGGYLGKKGLIFSTVFQAIKDGQGSIKIQDIITLLNDGKGTAAKTTTSNLQFAIFKQLSVAQPEPVPQNDTALPEVFEPIVANDPVIFNGKYFLVFTTQDKGSGISHYEVREGDGPFIVAESPYLLQNQSLDEEITVKAVDKSGNEKLVTLSSPRLHVWYKDYIIYVIIIIAIIMAIAYLVWKTLAARRSK